MYSVKSATSYEEWMASDEAQTLTSADPLELLIIKENLEEQGLEFESIEDLLAYL